MIIESSLETFGSYCIFMRRVFALPQKWRVFGRKFLLELGKLGID